MRRFLLGGVLLSAALVAGAAAHTGVMVIDVDQVDGPRIVAPVPLGLVQLGLALAPEEAQRIEASGLECHLPDLRRTVRALRDAPDGSLVEVAEDQPGVTVTKEGDALRLAARDEAAVFATVPLAWLEAAVAAYDEEGGYFRTSRLVAALDAGPRGDLLRVVDGEDRVRVRRLF